MICAPRLRALSVVVPVVVPVVAALAGCDLFGIRCDADSDCPPEQEFCNLGLCSTVDGPVRAEGEGEEGEGEAGEVSCDDDAGCDGGVCANAAASDEFFDAAHDHVCVPLASDVVDCAAAAGLGIDRRDDFVIYAGAVTRNLSASCASGARAVTTTLRFVSRTQRLNEGFAEARTRSDSVEGNGGGPFTVEVHSTDGTSGEIVIDDFTCYPDADDTLAVAVGLSSPASNALCLDISAVTGDGLP